MSKEMDNLDSLNVTELQDIIRRQTGVIVRRSISQARLIEIIRYKQVPQPHEFSDTMRTREELQAVITKNWEWLNSQLPCKGPNQGKCTIYPCPDGRHLDCYLSAKKLKL